MEIKTITAFIVAFTTLIGLAVTGWSKLADIQGQLDTIAAYETRIEVVENDSANALADMELLLEGAISKLEKALETQATAIDNKLQTVTDQAIQTAGQIGALESKVDNKIEDAIIQYNSDTKNPLAV